MSSKIDKLIQKREALERQIAAEQEAEKRKARVIQIIYELLEKHPAAMQATDQIIREKLNAAVGDIAKFASAA